MWTWTYCLSILSPYLALLPSDSFSVEKEDQKKERWPIGWNENGFNGTAKLKLMPKWSIQTYILPNKLTEVTMNGKAVLGSRAVSPSKNEEKEEQEHKDKKTPPP